MGQWWVRRAAMVLGLIECLGIGQTARILYRNYVSKGRGPVRLKPKRLRHAVHLRPGTSDFHAFCQIVALREYDFENFPDFPHAPAVRERYDKLLEEGKRPLIVDAGANIGLASAWFASCFPEAIVVAVEPEGGNFSLLAENAAPYGNVVPIQAALWGSEATVFLSDASGDAWAFRVREDAEDRAEAGGGVAAVTAGEVIARSGADSLLIAKIDIEGAEASLFSGDTGWVRGAKLLIVELHDHLMPFLRVSASFYRMLSRIDSEVCVSGENTFVFIDPEDRRAPALTPVRRGGGGPGVLATAA